MRQAYIDGSTIARMLVCVKDESGLGDVVVVGSMNADHTVVVEKMPQPGETTIGGPMTIHAGGKSANQASTCAHLGQRTHMLGAVGTDANAELLVAELMRVGVVTSDIQHVSGASGSTVIVVDARGENFVVVSPGSNSSVTAEYVHRHRRAIESASVLGLCLESPFETAVASTAIASASDTTVVLNVSPMPSNDEFAELRALCQRVDVVIMNEHEATQFLGFTEAIGLDSDWTDIYHGLRDRGLHRVIVTLGADGSMVLGADAGMGSLPCSAGKVDDDAIVHIPALHVTPVDTTGAGDAFMGSVLAGLAHGAGLVDSCLMASVVSAYATLGRGAQSSYGDTNQIIEFLRQRVASQDVG